MDLDNQAAIPRDAQQVEAWIGQAREGSAAALGKLLEACRNYLLSIANEELSEPLRAKIAPSDLVQDTALEAFRDFASFQGARLEELLGWLRRILVNNVANASRRFEATGKRQISRELRWADQAAQLNGLEDGEPSPSSVVAAGELQQRVERALNQLSTDLRTVILLRNREGYSFAEIGIEMGRSAEAARKLWARAIDSLQKELRNTHERA